MHVAARKNPKKRHTPLVYTEPNKRPSKKPLTHIFLHFFFVLAIFVRCATRNVGGSEFFARFCLYCVCVMPVVSVGIKVL